MSEKNGELDLRVPYSSKTVVIAVSDKEEVKADLAELYNNIAASQHGMPEEDKTKSWLWMPAFLTWLQERYHRRINYQTAIDVAELVLTTYPALKKKHATTLTSQPATQSTPST